MMCFIPKNKKAILPLTAGLTLILGCFLAGCEESAPPEKPAVVTKRIDASKAVETPKADPAESPAAPKEAEKTPTAPAAETTKTEVPAPVAETKPAKAPDAAEERTAKAVQSDTAAAVGAPAGADVTAETADAAEPVSLASSLFDETFPKYDPKGRVDPFSALFSKDSEAELAEDNRPQRPLTPLEKIDISQLELVAVLLAQSGNRAMVEDRTGKPYILTTGTYIGINSGTVKKILKDRVVIEEKTKNFLGKESTSTRELKLQKPFGEE